MKKSNYEKCPCTLVKGFDGEAFEGYTDILKELKKKCRGRECTVITAECYPGVRVREIVSHFQQAFLRVEVVYSDDYSYSGEEITRMIHRELTDDRVFGVLTCRTMEEFFDPALLAAGQEKIKSIKESMEGAAGENGGKEAGEKIILVIGTGASLLTMGDILVYADLARWEIQLRYRSGELANWKMDNYEEDTLRKYKRGFFVEWRVADRLKQKLFPSMDYLLDTNRKEDPKMLTRAAFMAGIDKTVSAPFRVVPYFDPGVWGGQWMKEVCGLDRDQENFAWSFDGVPEENSLYLKYGDVRVEVPSIDAVFLKPVELLGDRVHARFGKEFPIRFDFLDTMGGQNLSLQVHPLTEYIQQNFGMHYTQDESYYILDAGEDAVVYLGVKEGIDKEAMIADLERADRGEITFPDEKYINSFPARKHDHFLIPAGTIHCSGKNSMVLEISATPYIFTFKLWDWDRLGLDGRPRPVHIDHGKQVIQWNRDTKWVKENLVGQVSVLEEGDGYRQERTGLHEREFIETRRHWFCGKVCHNTMGSVNVLNLVEGREAIVESPSGAFDPFVVHYAETFIIPEQVKEYTIRPFGESEGKEIATIKAYVRV